MALTQLKSMPELMKKGLETYKSLKQDMEKALGFKEYANQLSQITQTFKDVNEHLDEKEKKVVETLNDAYSQSQEALEKATLVVSMIKEQSKTLVDVLSPSDSGSDHDKMLAACLYFSGFAKDIETKVNDAEKKLLKASTTLYSAKSEISSIVTTLKKLQDKFVAEKKAAQKAERAKAYGGAAVGILGLGIGLLVSYGIAAAVVESLNIPEIERKFEDQRQTISGYISGFEAMHSKAEALSKQLSEKRSQLIDIHSKLTTAGTLAGNESAAKSVPLVHYGLIRQKAQALVESCDTFLKTLK